MSDSSTPSGAVEAGRSDGERFDVIVIGAGVAGVACASAAATGGARVAILDTAAVVGGTAAGAGGGTCIAGSALQARLGIEDSIDAALEDWIAWGGDTVDVVWAERYLRASAPLLFDDLAEAGVRWVGVDPHEGNRVPRWHRPEGGGKRVMAVLEARARALPGIAWRLEHRVLDLLRAGGRITGVRAVHAGRTIELSAPVVVVASGGFNNDAELVAKHAVQASSAERVLLGGGLGALGEGHRMLQDVGAQFTELDAVWMYPYATPDYRREASGRGLAIRGVEGEIWVNDDGARFHDEHSRGGATGTTALLEQANGRGWSVFDARIASRMIIADPEYTDGSTPIRERVTAFLRNSPYVRSASTPVELAARMGVDRTRLQAAIGDMNAAIAIGLDRDPEFHKPLAGLSGIEAAPFYAVRLYPMARKNLGGVRTDLEGQVLDAEDNPIPGLFAAGEVAGMAGGRINGRAALEGTAFGPSLFSGIVAGSAATDRPARPTRRLTRNADHE